MAKVKQITFQKEIRDSNFLCKSITPCTRTEKRGPSKFVVSLNKMNEFAQEDSKQGRSNSTLDDSKA